MTPETFRTIACALSGYESDEHHGWRSNIADRLGVDYRAVRRWDKDRHPIPETVAAEVWRIAEETRATLDRLLKARP